MQKAIEWWKKQSLVIKAISSFVVLSVACCFCIVSLAVITPDRTPTPETIAQSEGEASVPEDTPAPTDTPLPTDTPAPTNTPVPELAFVDIVQHPDEKGWNNTQYTTYIDTLKGQAVSGWSGTILEIDEFAGEPYLSLDIEPGEPEIDAYIYINDADVLKVGLGQNVTFAGTIDSKWSEGNGFYSLQIKEATLLELSEIPTPTPVPPTPTPGPTNTPTPDIGTETMAEVMCEQFVEDNLRSPSTADFGGLFDDRDEAVLMDAETASQLGVDVSSLRNVGVWVVRGEVDAENAFGAMIRSEYLCVLDYEKEGETWYLLDISIEAR